VGGKAQKEFMGFSKGKKTWEKKTGVVYLRRVLMGRKPRLFKSLKSCQTKL